MQTAVRSPATLTNARPGLSASALRLVHSYVSASIAPMIVFFAISGTLQLFNLHESRGSYKTNPLISSMARLHKNQIFAPEPEHRQRRSQNPKGEPGPPGGGPGESPPTLATQALKVLFALEAVALVVTTLLGVWIGVTHPKRARTFWIVLAAGTLLPVVLIFVGDR